MSYFDWSEPKNDQLKAEREVSFEDVVVAISEGRLHDIVAHINPAKYPNQRIYIVEISSYIYAVPFVKEGEKIFLKTIYPSRKWTKLYLKGEEL